MLAKLLKRVIENATASLFTSCFAVLKKSYSMRLGEVGREREGRASFLSSSSNAMGINNSDYLMIDKITKF